MVMPESLVRAHLRTVKPYSSARDEYEGELGIFLDANENSLGSATSELYNRYPDPHHKALKARWSAIKGVATDRIFFGNGSDEPIDLLIRLFCEPGQDYVVTTPPTYGMYEVSAAINAVENRQFPLTRAFGISDELMAQEWDDHAKILFLCSPNNPSGNLLDVARMHQLIGTFPGIVVVDEAYIDFSSEQSWVNQLEQHRNLVVLQTLSKAWGMAGIRVGVAMADSYVITMLDRIKPPYNLSIANQQLALEALQHQEKQQDQVKVILSERGRLVTALRQMPKVSEVIPSDTNFLLVRFENAQKLFDFLIAEQLIVRNRTKQLHCQDCLRITVGKPDENDRLLELIGRFYY